MSEKKDVFGNALLEYFQYPRNQKLTTWTSLTEEDAVPISYFFRAYEQMPALEQKAMEISCGKILDVGCGTGCHSLYLQNQRKFEVTGIDNSTAAIKTASQRGLIHTINQSIFDYEKDTFDTILLLMNGTGICGQLETLELFLNKLKSLLNPKGQILLDSSDLIYLFDQTRKGEKIIPASNYYGEVQYGVRFKNEIETFPWLYVDFGLLRQTAHQVELETELILEGKNWDYLARLTMGC